MEIDPQLQELQEPPPPPPHSTRSPRDYAPSAASKSIKLPPPPTSESPYQHPQQHLQHLQHGPQHSLPLPYARYPQDGPFSHYHGLPPQGHHFPSGSPPNGYQPPPGAAHSPHQYVSTRHGEAKRLRACEACRGLKVRCEPDPTGGACKRCLKAGRKCEITAPSRKRQKKTDNKVAELEKKLDEMSARLGIPNASHGARPGGSGSEGEQYEEENSIQFEAPNLSNLRQGSYSQQQPLSNAATDRRHQSPYAQQPSAAGQKRHHSEIDRNGPTETHMYGLQQPSSHDTYAYQVSHAPKEFGTYSNRAPGRPEIHTIANSIDGKLANDYLRYYTAHMTPHMPVVSFAPPAEAEQLRHSKPLLFVVVMCVASVRAQTPLPDILIHDMLQTLAELVFVNGEKSLELVQSLQVVAIWYWQRKKPSTFYQYVYAAAIMAIDIGINKPFLKGDDAPNASALASNEPDIQFDMARAWLGCFALSSIAAMGRRQPNLIVKDDYMDECVAMLALPHPVSDVDRSLCQVIKLQNLPETHVPLDLASDHTLPNPKMIEFHERIVQLYKIEAAQRFNPKSPFRTARVRSKAKPDLDKPLELLYTSAIFILDTFSRLDTIQARALPPFRFTQVAHACVCLMRLHLTSIANPESGESAAFDAAVVEDHIARAIRRCDLSIPDGKNVPGESFQKMMAMLQLRYQDAKAGGDGSIAKLEGSAAGNQALHLLSELATGSSGQADDKKGQNGGKQNPAGALVLKLLGIGKKDLLDDRWFDELIMLY